MRPILVAVVLSGCTLYEPEDQLRIDGAVVPWPYPDAQRAPDARLDECAQPLPCPAAGANRVTVCGRLYDVESARRIQAAAPTWSRCGSGGEATDGPCQLAIRFHDALAFTSDPEMSTPLVPQDFRQDDCGRFVAHNIPRPSLGFLGISVDDAATSMDVHRQTVIAFPVTSGQVRNGVLLHALRRSTDVAWTAQAGLGASTFADRGAILAWFRHGSVPDPGVRITVDGELNPAGDHYFSDMDPTTSSTIAAALDSTGPNGAALLLGSALVEHSGTGSEPPGCVWPSDLAASIPGVLWVHPRVAETPSGDECP